MTTSNLDESYQYDDTANPPQIIQLDTSFIDPLLDAESYADVVTVSDDVDTCLSEIQYAMYDSLDDSSRPAFSTIHAYDNNNGMHSSGGDKCIPQKENVTLEQVESSIEAQDYLELIDYDDDPPGYEKETIVVPNIKMAGKVHPKSANKENSVF